MRVPIIKPDQYFENMYKIYPVDVPTTKEMMRYFFMLGYRHASDQVVDLVGDWACSVAGCAAELRKPEDLYDGVEHDLINFFKDQIGDTNE